MVADPCPVCSRRPDNEKGPRVRVESHLFRIASNTFVALVAGSSAALAQGIGAPAPEIGTPSPAIGTPAPAIGMPPGSSSSNLNVRCNSYNFRDRRPLVVNLAPGLEI